MRKRYKVLLYEPMHAVGTELLKERCEVCFPQSLDEVHLMGLMEDIDGIIIRFNGKVTRGLMERAPKLKVIGRHGVGLENVDLKAARELGIKVVYTPQANAVSVAEHFVALALVLLKNIKLADKAVRDGRWSVRTEMKGRELHGKVLGVLGMGRVGQQTARICRLGFAMEVFYYDVRSYPQVEAELGARKVSLEELFREADLISINLPLVPQTRHLVGKELLFLMKPTAYIINMARGPIWREQDLAEALIQGRIAGAASDVFEEEPPEPSNPLLRLDNFIATPHSAAHTEESLIRMSLVAKDVLRVLEGEEPEFPVPEEVYAQYEGN